MSFSLHSHPRLQWFGIMKKCLILSFLFLFAAFALPSVAQDTPAKTPAVEKAAEHYSHFSKKLDKSYYLFSKEMKLKNSDKVRTIYFFGKEKVNARGGKPMAKVPEDKVVSETKNGMLVLKNKPDAKKK